MANINDFKLLNLKSKKFLDLLAKEYDLNTNDLNDKTKERLGFYLFALEKICDKKDLSDLADMITDTEFNQIVFNQPKIDDLGVDAIFIDHENLRINLFNFKFRESFNQDKKQSLNETFLSAKFINALINENTKGLKDKLKKFADEIIEKFNSNEIWKTFLYVVSNENVPANIDDQVFQDFKNLYDLEIIPINLEKIKMYMSIRPEPICASFILNSDAVMSYAESSISSAKSYIIRLPISEVIRITSSDSTQRMNYKIEDISILANCQQDLSVLFDNVRGFVQKSKYNQAIEKTLKEDISRFFMYNNGLTLTANDIRATEVNAGKKVKFEIDDFQILNGGQTLRTIHKFNQEDNRNISDYLAKGEVLVRIFKTVSDSGLINKIAEYTNSQNSISNVDLKSLSSEQIHLEQFLSEHKILYSRKSGDTGIIEQDYEHKVSMERYGQILFSLLGYPEKASNQKKQIFDKYYDLVFGEDSLDIQSSVEQINRYFKVKKEYEKSEFSSSDQKIFYVLYMDKHLTDFEISQIIERLEELIKAFSASLENATSDARILIQSRFKKYLDENCSIY